LSKDKEVKSSKRGESPFVFATERGNERKRYI
jgi:hypothetical protein